MYALLCSLCIHMFVFRSEISFMICVYYIIYIIIMFRYLPLIQETKRNVELVGNRQV